MSGPPPAGKDAPDPSDGAAGTPVHAARHPDGDHAFFHFEYTPVATWEEDFREVGAWMDRLRESGVTDLRSHLARHPELAREALRLVRVVRVNPAAVAQNAARDRDHLLASLPQLFSEESYRSFVDELVAIWSGQNLIEHEFHSRRLDGAPLDVIVRLQIPVLEGRRDLSRVIVTGTDISGRKNVERTSRELQVRYSSVVENVPVCLFRKDLAGRYTFANDQFCAFLGRQLGELIGKTDFDFFPSELAEAYRRDDMRAIEANEVVNKEELNTRPDGALRHVQVIKTPLRNEHDRPIGVQIMFWDITERKKAEEALRESQQTLAGIAATMPHTLYVFDIIERRTIYSNREIWLDLGYSAHEGIEFRQDFLTRLLHPEDTARLPELLTRWDAARDGQVIETEYRLLARSGEWRWFRGRDTVYQRSDDGRVRQIIGTCEDITEHKHAIAALRDSEAFLRMSQRVGRLGSWEWDIRTNRVRWSDGMFLIYGLAHDQFDGTLESSIRPFHPEDVPGLRANIDVVVKGGEGRPYEYRVIRPDGTIGHMWGNGEITRDKNGEPTVMMGTVVDITERKQFEEERRRLELQIQHAQKLESLGVLTGGIAHDFNNLLTGILGYASLALGQLPAGSEIEPMLREVVGAGKRAADLTQQMLAYAGKGQFVIQPVRLDALVREMSNLLHTVVSKKAAIEHRLAPCAVNGDPSQLRQVAMNLIINASDALGNSAGSIRIRTGVRSVTPDELHSSFIPDELPGGDYAFVEVEDTGSGMSPDTLQRIFDPFFSTKFTGRGLGLAAVLGIVRAHRGTIQVESVPGRGTRFEVLFPAISEELDDRTPDPDTMPRGRGTVLVVDDERSVRTFARRALEAAGFSTRLAADGREAIEEFFRPYNDFVAVLLDMTMPHMDGLDVLRRLRERGSNVPVLVMSGYSEYEILAKLRGLGAAGAIQKPFQPRELVTRLCELLAALE